MSPELPPSKVIGYRDAGPTANRRSVVSAWVWKVTGRPVLDLVRRTGVGGDSRETWFVHLEGDGADRELVVRADPGDGPSSDGPFTLAREARVCAGLVGAGVALPEILCTSDDGMLVLMTRAPGSSDISALNREDRGRIMDSFLVELARLHQLDPASIDTGLIVPTDARAHALVDLAMWREAWRSRVSDPLAVMDEALAWLFESAPSTVSRTSLIHGDAGPGNFLHEDGRVTALLDWEFAHVGDPMDDLAWLWFRTSMWRFTEELGTLFRRYAEISGTEVRPEVVTYYRVAVLFRCAVCASNGCRYSPRFVAALDRFASRLGQALGAAGAESPATRAAAARAPRPIDPLPW